MPDSSGPGYRLIDADNHYYEPYDCFTRHLEPAFADRAVHVVKDDKGLGRARIDEAGLPVAIHTGDSGYNELWSVQWGEQPRPPLQYMTPFQWYLGFGGRPITDMLANLILNNLFGRFPRLRVLSIENGSDWVPALLKDMDKAAKVGRRGTPVGGHVQEVPSEVFRRHVWVSPYFEEDPVPLSEVIGVDRVLFGSDWPHPEGLAEPARYIDVLDERTKLTEEEKAKVMGGNMARLIAA